MNTIQINKPGKSLLVLIAVPTGSFYEIDAYKGISHFVEHLCFKGNPKRTQKEISASIDNIGGDINAFTDREITCYYAKVGRTYRDIAEEVIVDLVTKPIFPIKEVDKEREVIIQEMKMYDDDTKTNIFDLFNKQIYAKQSGFYLPIIGTNETLFNIKRDNIVDYHKKTYSNPTLIIIGEGVSDIIDIQKTYDIRYIPSELAYNPKDLLITRKNLTQSNIIIGNSVNIQDNDIDDYTQMFCLKILSAIYGDMSGRLFDTIREKNNMVYRISFDWDLFSNGTIQWCVTAGLDKNKINKARELIIKELSRPLSKKDIDIALTKSIGITEMSSDNVEIIGSKVAYSLISGMNFTEIIYNYEDYLKESIKVVNEFIKKMNFNNNILVGITPEK